MRYLGTDLTEQAQDLYAENDKILLKDIAEILSKGRETTVVDWKIQYCQGISFSRMDV